MSMTVAAAALTRPREYLLPVGIAVIGTMVAMGGLAVAGLVIAVFFALPAVVLAFAVVRPVERRLTRLSTGWHAVILCGCWISAGAGQYLLNTVLTAVWFGSAPALGTYGVIFFLPPLLAVATTIIRAVYVLTRVRGSR
jgi:hypothetical protein